MSKNLKLQLSVWLLIALVGLPQISETIYTPALPCVAAGLLATPHQVEATLAIYFLGFAAGVLLWGIISDAFGRRSAMLAGLFIYLLCTLACAQAKDVQSLLLYRFFQAFGASAGSVVTQTILRDAFEGQKRAQLFSLISAALAFSPAVGPVLGAFISQYFGWRANFYVLTVFALLLVSWTWRSLPETRPPISQMVSWPVILNVGAKMFQSTALWGHIFLIGSTNAIVFGFYQEAPFVFIEQLGFSPSQYGCFGVLIAAATLFAAWISYAKSHNLAAHKMIAAGALCMCLGAILLIWLVLLKMYVGSFGLILMIATLFLIFLGIGLVIPNSLSLALKPYQKSAGTAGSLFGVAYYGYIAICTWVMSYMHNDTFFPLTLYILALTSITLIGSQMHRLNLLDAEL